MPTLTMNGPMTFAQIAKALGPDGEGTPILDSLSGKATILDDMPFTKANQIDKHRIDIRDGTANPSFVGMNSFANVSTINRKQKDEYIGIIEDYSQLDDRIDILTKEGVAERDRIDRLKVGDVARFMASHMFYGSRADNPLAFDGMATRANKANDPSLATWDTNRPLCLPCSGSANRSSIFLVEYGEEAVGGIYGQNGSYGVKLDNMGRVPVYAATGTGAGVMYAYQTRVRMHGGLRVGDAKKLARIANIDTTVADPWTTYTLKAKINTLRTYMEPNSEIYAYCHPNVFARMQDFLQDKGNVSYKADEFGREYFDWMGLRWRPSLQIGNTETAVS